MNLKPQPTAPARLATRLEFEALQALPCGCIVASFRAEPWALELIRLEAKGPHCFHLQHSTGSVLSLDAEEADEESADLQ